MIFKTFKINWGNQREGRERAGGEQGDSRGEQGSSNESGRRAAGGRIGLGAPSGPLASGRLSDLHTSITAVGERGESRGRSAGEQGESRGGEQGRRAGGEQWESRGRVRGEHGESREGRAGGE